VIGDELQLRQVIGNLLSNAVQHTPAGTPVTVTVGTEGGNEVVLSVEDAGPGLAPDDASRVFERFFRTDPSRTRSEPAKGYALGHSGSGLGLSIVHALVAAHGGTIRLETAPGAGARFEVRLPLFAPAAEVSTQPEAS
jgi:two-component system OmpR family sensor kinase